MLVPSVSPGPYWDHAPFYLAWRIQIGVLLPQSLPNSVHGHTRDIYSTLWTKGQRYRWVGATEKNCKLATLKAVSLLQAAEIA